MKKYKLSLFIFRRDLRLSDNTGLIKALDESEFVLPCFIFDPNQVTTSNKYKSDNAIQFMIESLEDLENQLEKRDAKLLLFYSKPDIIIGKLLKELAIQAIYVNRDYTPYSIERDKRIKEICNKNKVNFFSFSDLLLNEPEDIKNKQGKPYTIFTPFYKFSSQIPVREPQDNKFKNFYIKNLGFNQKNIYKKILKEKNPDIYVSGGRTNCSKILKNIKNFSNYINTRDLPEFDTTLFSAHLKFGTYSVREIFYKISQALGHKHPLLRQLYWRDFFTHIAFNFPHIFGRPFKLNYNNIEWSEDRKKFELWCNGKTGFPIVDAGMRQLNKTGFMHNRVRMIVGSFLVKDLHLNWLWGEKYFAQKLVDYDPSVNNGNWQWCASTGCDSQPYFRIFNPWLQQKKFDPECIYIKRYIPELKNVDPKIINTWYLSKKEINGYPLPILDHSIQAEKAKKLFKKALYK